MKPNYELIDPATLMRISSLELRAKHVVEGFCTGFNRSPWHGFSVEFSEYRQYNVGDDPRYLDWKLYARSDRHYIRRFEDETNLRCHLLVDFSPSMAFGSIGYTKIDYARTMAATLAYFLQSQRDAVGLLTFGETVGEFLPARYRTGHFRRLLVGLERELTGTQTNLISPLKQAAEQVRQRGLLILISDLLTPLDELKTHLGYLRARGHEVAVFQVLDPREQRFDFTGPMLFEDLESHREIYVDPAEMARRYRERFQQHLAYIETICATLGVTLRLFSTDRPLEHALFEFLQTRMGSAGKGHRA